MIAFACPHCAQKLKVKDDFAGRNTKCPTCKVPLTVPVSAATQSPVQKEGAIEGPASSLEQTGVFSDVTLAPGNGESAASVPDVLAKQDGKPGQRYTVAGEIARGGMGAVLRAVDRDIRREVAVKFMLDPNDNRKKRRFVEEAQITGQLEHPNIVPIHELGVDARKRLFFSMKMVKGESLMQVLDQVRADPRQGEARYPLPRLLNAFVGICHALAYAHARGVVHRDLKPANVMLGDFGEVYVMDWGLAKVVGRPDDDVPNPAVERVKVTTRSHETDLTQEGAILGTPAYMPPEQAAGRPVDARSDVYSLGAMLYEILTLQPPVERDGGHMQVLMRVVEGDVVAPEQRAPQRARAGKIPRELSAVAMKALAKEPGDRYADVAALRHDIELYQEGRSVSAKQDSVGELAWKLVKRNKAASLMAVAAMFFVMFIIAVSFLFINQARLHAVAERKVAQDNYDSFVAEQKAKRERGQKSAPLFLTDARRSANDGKLDYALAQANVALDYDPDLHEARLAKAQVLAAKKEFPAAVAELERFAKATPDDRNAAELLKICREGKDDAVTAHLIAGILSRQKMFGLAAQLETNRDQLLDTYRQRLDDAYGSGMGARLTVKDGQFKLAIFDRKEITDLEPLRGMPLSELYLYGCNGIRDLSPLQDMQTLTHLDINGLSRIDDLSVLRNLRLTQINISSTKVRDLSPLQDMPMTAVLAGSCSELRDLSPLRKFKLKELAIPYSSVTDISFVDGMPLESLNLGACYRLSNLEPLRNLPLRTLELGHCGAIRDLTPIRNLKLRSFHFPNNPAMKDLGMLRNMPLNQLSLYGCSQIEDFRPLHDLPDLSELTLRGCEHIEDLSPLKGLRLKKLGLQSCARVRSLEPLRGMPLTYLDLRYCGRALDLAPLEGMQLTHFVVSPHTIDRNMDVIRRMKTLQNIDLAHNDGQRPITASGFWKRYDNGEFPSANTPVAGAVTKFLVVGSFPKPLAEKGPPEDNPDPSASYTGLNSSKVRWKEVDTLRSGYLDLHALFPRKDMSNYAMVFVQSPKDQPAEMLLGSDDGVRVWINGTLVHDHDTGRLAWPDADNVNVRFKAGWNRVLVKVNQGLGEHGLYLRFAGAPGLEYSLQTK